MYSNRLIFKTSLEDELYYLKDTIFVKFNVGRNGISTSKLNGGFSDNFKSVFNHHLTQENIDYLENHDVKDYLIDKCKSFDADFNYSTGLITLDGKFGTINTIILINVNLAYETLLEAFMCATEAKTVALHDLKIPSQYSNGYATGTGTDGLCIFSNSQSDIVISNAGKHSKMGELIGKCVIESVKKAIKKQVWISNYSQSNVLVRLNRYKLDINEFYESIDCDKDKFIRQLQIDARNQKNVAIATSVLNLIDEVNYKLIDKNDAYDMAIKIKNDCNSYTIKTLLEYWINYFIH